VITARNLWAKLVRDGEGSITGWHSLVHHSADVAAVLLTLLDQPTINSRLARLAGRDTLEPVTRERLGALAFLHDIGKANRGFRARVDPHAPLVGHIDQVAWLFTSSGTTHCRRLFDVLDLDRLEAWFPDESWGLIDPVFAHHGRPWCLDSARNELPNWRPGADCDPIADLTPMREALDCWFSAAFEPGPRLPSEPGFHHAFAGLLMLADWLGSDSGGDFFPFANGTGPDRMLLARKRARHAVRAVGLESASAGARARTAEVGFAQAFGVKAPHPVQSATVLPDAQCVVLEAETGSGKTEAALWRFKHLFEQGAVDGLYFALPTRVAATAMFERIKLFRDRVFGGSPPAVVLAVPGQAAVDDAEGRPLPGFGFEWNDAPEGGANRARWTAEHPKRFLAATIAVGTVDQALLGAIRIRHAHMRGAALLRHLLVVDEVHASDRYMEALLGVLLRNHLGAGGHALLLSATLGAAARARLLRTPCPGPIEAEAVPYPALSWAMEGKETRHQPERRASKGTVKAVQVELAPLLDSPDGIAQLAMSAAEADATVLVLRNTVIGAVATAQALEALAGSEHPAIFRVGGVATVHHGRFAARDRRALDAAVESVLGRKRGNGGRVVAGTQTLEVSLDLDADLLITDLCPADVLLQRIGRLHRHAERDRPAGFAAPKVVVLVPTSRDLVRFTGRTGGRHGLGRVYDDLRVVEATWREIETRPVWSIPDDNRRLVERTTHPAHLARIEAELVAGDAAAWTRHIQNKDGSVAAELGEAASARLDWATPFEDFRLDADEHVTTRLGAADRQVDLPGEVLGPFGLPVTVLRIPHFLLAGVAAEAGPEDVRQRNGAIHFRLGAQRFRYDRFGLQRDEP
jgi:CRISPR-associated endonuclease/helicase Cas3